MKLSVTTLGCFKWDLPTVLANVRDYGFGGIDFRGLAGELRLWLLREFSSGVAQTATMIGDHGLQVTCISSGILLAADAPEKVADCDEELLRSAEICAALGCSQIRVFGGGRQLGADAPEAEKLALAQRIADRASALAEKARTVAPVDILIETHDSWTSSVDMTRVLSLAGRGDVACCWDLKHTYWVAQETPATTWERLQPSVRNTHWKDARRHYGTKEDYGQDLSHSGRLCPVGEGIVPLADCYDLLRASGYDGWLTLEWEKRWHPYLEEPEEAFPGFVAYMRELEGNWARHHGESSHA